MITVSSGHTSSGLTLHSGDILNVLKGGTAIATTVSSGGFLLDHGRTSTTTLRGVAVISGGRVSATALELVSAGGFASGTVVSSGGGQVASSGGIASGTRLTGTPVFSGGFIFPTALQVVTTHGVARGTVVSGGGAQAVSSGGVASGTHLVGQIASSGGFSFDTAAQQVVGGGIVRGTVVGSGGAQYVSSGGVASNTTVSSGGTELIFAGGVASNSLVQSGGTVTDSGAMVFTNAGRLAFAGFLSGGGTVTEAGSGTLVLRGNANAFSGTETISRGTVELIAAGAAGKGTIRFAGSGAALKIDAGAPTNTISGFVAGQKINLAAIAFNALDTATYSGTTLTVKNGGGTVLAKLRLVGAYASNSFHLSADPIKGTDVTTTVTAAALASARFSMGADTIAAAPTMIAGATSQFAGGEHFDAASGNSTLQGGAVFPLLVEAPAGIGGIPAWVEIPGPVTGVPSAAADFARGYAPDIALGGNAILRDGTNTIWAGIFVHAATVAV